MNSPIRPIAFLLFLVLVINAPLQAFSDNIYTTERFQVSGPVVLNATTSGGSITVESHEKNEVVIDVIVRRGSSYFTGDFSDIGELRFDKNGNTISVEANVQSGFFRRGSSVSVSYVIKTPAETSAHVRTSGGSLSLSGLEGSQRLQTRGGSITLSEIGGTVDASTSGGGISMYNIKGELSARTSGGSIKMENSSGNFDVQTSGGSITLNSISGNMSARTSGGSINAEFKDLDEHLSLRTSAGSITAVLPSHLVDRDGKGLVLDAQGSRVSVSGESGSGFSGETSSRRIQGSYGKGGVKAEFRTSAGNVNITYKAQ